MEVSKLPFPLPPIPNLQRCGRMEQRGDFCHRILILPTCVTCAEDVGLAMNYSKLISWWLEL